MKSKKLYELNDDKHVRVQLPTSADNVTLLAVAAEAPAVQQSTDISCLPPGAQQQTRRTLLQRSIDGTDRLTDRRTDTVPLHSERVKRRTFYGMRSRSCFYIECVCFFFCFLMGKM